MRRRSKSKVCSVHPDRKICNNNSMGWSDIPTELLLEITKRLDLVDVIRSGAVCTWWSSIPFKDKYAPRPQMPWLMLSSKDKPNSRYFYSLTEKKTYELNLPDIAGQHCVGSGHGYLLSVDHNANLIATNPVNGGSHLPLPPTSGFPHVESLRRDSSGNVTEYFTRGFFRKVDHMIRYLFSKAILSPDTKYVVIIEVGSILFARVGDQSWTNLQMTGEIIDIIFHKGRLHAIDLKGTLYVFDLGRKLEPSFVSQQGPILGDHVPRRYLVESPNGDDLFLLAKVIEYDEHDDLNIKTVDFDVFILDKATYTWKQIWDLEGVSFILGLNYSTSLRASDVPGSNKHCIYFTDDYIEFFMCFPEKIIDHGVFHFDDDVVKPIYEDNNLDKFNWPPPIWFMPAIV